MKSISKMKIERKNITNLILGIYGEQVKILGSLQ